VRWRQGVRAPTWSSAACRRWSWRRKLARMTPSVLALVAINVLSITSPKEKRMNGEIEEQESVLAEDLIEEVSIDGMCGVY
jgi:mycofactocin precursor